MHGHASVTVSLKQSFQDWNDFSARMSKQEKRVSLAVGVVSLPVVNLDSIIPIREYPKL